MRSLSWASVLGVSILVMSLGGGCSSTSDPGTGDTGGTDTGLGGHDTGVPGIDTGVPPVDTGVPPVDGTDQMWRRSMSFAFVQ